MFNAHILKAVQESCDFNMFSAKNFKATLICCKKKKIIIKALIIVNIINRLIDFHKYI